MFCNKFLSMSNQAIWKLVLQQVMGRGGDTDTRKTQIYAILQLCDLTASMILILRTSMRDAI